MTACNIWKAALRTRNRAKPLGNIAARIAPAMSAKNLNQTGASSPLEPLPEAFEISSTASSDV